jgi:multidrug efflux pump
MKLSELCIRRPVFATVLSLIIVLLGLVSYSRLAVREYPKIDPPVVSVTTTYRGASPEIIESQVTQILEEQLAGIEGVDFIRSSSEQDGSHISVYFVLGRDPSSAAADVRDRVSRARRFLPDDVEEPVIQKVETDAQSTIVLAFSSDRHSALEISDYVDRHVKDQLQTLPGVAQVTIFGERRYSMRIWLDPDRLAAYGVTPQDVEAALRRENVEVPAGLVESRDREFAVLSQTDFRTPVQFNDMVIRKGAGNYLVRLKDVGHAELGPQDDRSAVRFNGRAAVAVGVIKQATANPLDVAQEVRDKTPSIVATLPEGMHADVAFDRSLFIQESLKNVYWTIGEAIALVVAIIFLFLRSIRATLVPLVTIPVSLIGAFALMDAFGFSINTLTLLAMVLAIGLVVDDSIVMLENIWRHIEQGQRPWHAAIAGAREIGFAVMAMTLTLAAVYLPIGFMQGTTGRLFTEFALSLAGAVIVSGFVALTASPMMCSVWLRHTESHGAVYRAGERALDALTAGYRRLLSLSLNARPLVLLVGLAVAGSGFFFFTGLQSELAPFEDQGTLLGQLKGPEGATISYVDRYARQAEGIISSVPEVDRSFMIVGSPDPNMARFFAPLKPWTERDRTQREIIESIAPDMTRIAGVNATIISPPPLGRSFREVPIDLVIQTTQSYAELQEMMNKMIARARQIPGIVNPDSDLQLNTPQLRIQVDRDKAADLGISGDALGRTLETMLGGRQVTRFKREGKQYDVIVQVADAYRASPSDVPRLYVRGAEGRLVQLGNLVRIEERVAPSELNHFNQLRAAHLTANLTPGAGLGDVLAELDRAARDVLPPTAQVDYSGLSREYKNASGGVYMTFVLALAFIYLVLAAQFESFRSPLIIMLTVPLSIAGGLFALWLDGSTLNIYSQVGLVTLIGLITKHGILIVEFANQNRRHGMDLVAAVREAAITRLRPILMTTGAMVFGAVPLAMATGAGAASRQDIGLVIVGGLLVGTLFTLFVIPAVYTYLAGASRAVEHPEAAAQPAE